MISIVFDKLMQYQIVDPSDIIIWSFKTHGDNTTNPCIGVHGWDLLKAALDKAIGRVAIARQKVQTLRKEEEDAKAKAMAVENAEEMDVDAEITKKSMNRAKIRFTPLLMFMLQRNRSMLEWKKYLKRSQMLKKAQLCLLANNAWLLPRHLKVSYQLLFTRLHMRVEAFSVPKAGIPGLVGLVSNGNIGELGAGSGISADS